MSPGSMMIGFKYDIYPLIVLVSAVMIGHMLKKESGAHSEDLDEKRYKKYVAAVIIIVGA